MVPVSAAPCLVDAIVAALDGCSVERPIWHIDAAERWRLVRDTLLGHPAVRGGLRPRDLPIDGHFRGILKGISELHACQPPTDNALRRYRFGDWLYSFAVLVEPHAGATQPGCPPFAHEAVYECFREIRRALGLPDSGEFAKTCPVLHRLIGTVGWSIKDWHFIHSHVQTETQPLVLSCSKRARLAARIAMAQPAAALAIPMDQVDDRVMAIRTHLQLGGNDTQILKELASKNLRLLTAMTVHVQSYICRGRRHWLMRGASAWCSQVLSLMRDEIPRVLDGALLLSDSDVVVCFLVPVDCRDVGNVMADLWNAWSRKDGFINQFPRLGESVSVAECPDLDPRIAFPEISLQLGEPTSLLDLCLPEPNDTAEEDAQKRPAVTVAIRSHRDITRVTAAPPCPYVHDDVAITSIPPPWLETRGDNDGGAVEESFGFTCLVWSLCGTTLKAHWFHNAALTVRDLAPDLRMMPVHHGEWLKWLQAENEPLTFLKLDGDSVGKTFSCTPVPRRPYLSMELRRLVLARVMAATRAVVKQHVARKAGHNAPEGATPRHPTEDPCFPCDGRNIPLPADMVYVGGDDVFFCLPYSSVATFLAGFTAPVSNDHPEPWRSLSFTYAAVTLPSAQELDPKSERMQEANLLASHLVSDALKEVAKKNDVARLATVLAQIDGSEHFACNVWQPHLAPHDGTIDPAVAHGLHLRLHTLTR